MVNYNNYYIIIQSHKKKIKSFIKEIDSVSKSLEALQEVTINTKGLSGNQIKLLNPKDLGGANQLQSYINSINEIKNAENTTGSALFDSLQIEEYANTLSTLEPQQAALLMSTQGLNNAQIQQTLSAQNLSAAHQYQAMVDAGLLTNKQQLSNVELQSAIASATNSQAIANETMNVMGLSVAIEGEEAQTVELTAKKLQLAVASGMLTQAQAQEIAMTTGVSIAQKAQAATTMPTWIAQMKAMTLATWEQVTATVAWLATNPAGWAILAIGAIAGVTALMGAATTNVSEHREQLKNLKQEYDEVKSKLDSYNNDLATIKERMAELAAKDNLTFTEKEEYDNLVKQNNELQRTIDLLEAEEKFKKKELNKKFIETMAADVDNGNFDYMMHSVNGETYYYDNEQDYLTGQVQERNRLVEAKANAGSKEERNNIQEQIDEIDSYFQNRIDEWSADAEEIEYIANPTTEDEKKVNEWLDFINDAKDRMAIAMGSKNSKTNAFNRLVDNWQFDDTVQKLQDLGEQGAVTAETLNEYKGNPEFDKFVQKLVELGIIENETDLGGIASAFNNAGASAASANSQMDSATSSLEKLTSASQSIGILNNAFKELSDNGYLTLDSISQIKATVGDTIPNWDEYEQKLLTVKKGTAEYNQLMSGLTYATLEKQLGGVSALAQANEKYVSRLLEENGVLNANEVAHYAVERAKTIERIKTTDLSNAIADGSIIALQNEALQCGYTEGAFWNLIAQEQIFNSTSLDVSQKISALKSLMTQAGITGSVISGLTGESSGINKINDALALGVDTNKNGDITFNGNVYGKGQDALNKAMSDASAYAFQEELKKKYNNILVDYTNLTKPVNYSDNNDLPKEIQETKETFNWIETALSRVQRAVSNFGKTVAATWQSWKERNAALKKQMSAIRNEISLQDQAYIKYTNLANSVGLSDGYKTLVREGSINIETIESESIAEAIKLYQEYYEKALAARDASTDLKDELAALAQTKFSNLAQSFADLMSGNEHSISMYEATIDLMEKRGYTASASLYDSLKEAESKNQDILKEKYQSLSQALDEAVSSGAVVKYSEQWYQMQNEILAVEEAILQSNIALAEYDNALRDLEWNAFDKLHEEISEIYEETEFLDKLLSDEKKFNEDGSMTDVGQAALGLGVVNYKTHLAQAEEYAQELQRIREDLAKDPYNQTLLDREDELEEKHREVLTQIEDDEQSMIDKVSEGYDTLLDHMDQMIDKRKNMLSQAKDLYEYEKNISKQTQEIASLEKQLAAYQGDDSEEARATIQKLQVSLSEAKENLEETEYDKYISDQEEMLDTLRLQTEEWINARLDNEDQLLKDIVSSTEKNATMINDTLNQVVSSTGTTLSEAMSTIWSNDGDIGKAITEIKTYLAGMQKNADGKAKEQVQNNTPASSNSGTTPTTAPAPTSSTPATTSASTWGDFFIKKSDSYPKNKLNTETSIVDRLKYSNLDSSFSARNQYYTAMGGSGVYTGSSSQNSWMIAQMKANGYARGGFIGDMIRAAGEDGIALVRRGEGIIPTNMVPEWNALIHHLPQLNHSMFGSIPQHATNVSIDIGDIQMYGVNDPETFAHQLKQAMLNNNSIRNIMKDTTIGEAIGRNSMIRYTR